MFAQRGRYAHHIGKAERAQRDAQLKDDARVVAAAAAERAAAVLVEAAASDAAARRAACYNHNRWFSSSDFSDEPDEFSFLSLDTLA